MHDDWSGQFEQYGAGKPQMMTPVYIWGVQVQLQRSLEPEFEPEPEPEAEAEAEAEAEGGAVAPMQVRASTTNVYAPSMLAIYPWVSVATQGSNGVSCRGSA